MRRTSKLTKRRLSQTLLGTAALSTALLARSLIAPGTHAAVGGCRSDPVVVLSNGDTLDLSAIVSDDQSDVQQVGYTLDIPAGACVVSWQDTSALGPQDKLTWSADNPVNTYNATTKVTTGTPHNNVAADTTLVAVNGASTASAPGWTRQNLQMSVSP